MSVYPQCIQAMEGKTQLWYPTSKIVLVVLRVLSLCTRNMDVFTYCTEMIEAMPGVDIVVCLAKQPFLRSLFNPYAFHRQIQNDTT